MHITRVRLRNFRNYASLDLEGLADGVNIITGSNAQGKTNLVEAVNICANGRSFRVASDSRAIMHGQTGAYLLTEYESRGRKNTIEVLLHKDKKKGFKKNGIPIKSIKEMMGNLYAVVFSPEDIKMAKESPALRRAFLDGEISKIRPSYIDALKKYTEITAQKNALLKRRGQADLKTLLGVYNNQLANYIKVILKNRFSYVKKLNEYVASTQEAISGGSEKIAVKYKATVKQKDIEEQLNAMAQREIEERACLAGPHRDDMDIRLNGREIRYYASQGQLRTLMLAVKLACLKILEDSTGHVPVMILDDVFAELDDRRRNNLLKCLSGVQALITATEPIDIAKLPKSGVIEVKNGAATLIK